MLQDGPEARREVELHWRVSPCPHIVPIIGVYENIYHGRKCLLIVMEWCVPLMLCVVLKHNRSVLALLMRASGEGH